MSDPLGRSLAPRLVATLDRAIAYCQSTLNYGKAAEPAPQFARVALRPLAQEAASTAITASGKVEIHNEIPDDLAIRADAEQMFRVFLNILRNAVDALETAGPRTDTGAVVRLPASFGKIDIQGVRVRAGAAALDAHLDELADAFLVERLERVFRQQLLLQVLRDEGADVVAAEAEGHLRQVVRAEAEELGRLGHLVGGQRRALFLQPLDAVDE